LWETTGLKPEAAARRPVCSDGQRPLWETPIVENALHGQQ
jgi:hypothetical protein